ncbi:hypothetical protein EAL2_808p04420 (plasmid) [Peptoclostridium acidaminophilum DSM 3953]|uniref:Uncharacterized protein n=1 Tax=Peptoclostridium acidaminophilum DSM 3953 TaxID=1286171 RepID=W8UAX6_PEPAC|nr:hypothetical protein [Peptoclostridium acidaminophilum]AHM57946.1 hypothetical protein EAL2_808p04420 [Peptoclostridium acidaminophilum DSM 3953]
MKRVEFKKAVYIAAATVQMVLVAAVVQLSNLTTKKAGVMHHVYFMKDKYAQGIYSPANLRLQSIAIIAVSAVAVGLLAFAVRRKKSRFLKIQAGIAAVIGLVAWYVINSGFFKSLLAYPYFIMVFEIVLAIQMLILIGVKFTARDRYN